MAHSQALENYLKGFKSRDIAWPSVATSELELDWWRILCLDQSLEVIWLKLCLALPQLRLPQISGISKTTLYRNTVLRRDLTLSLDLLTADQILHSPQNLRLWVADHPFGAAPVLATTNYQDFIWLVRALAHRGEPIEPQHGVHAQAVRGLIHWGLIDLHGADIRASLILLHDAPYGSIEANELPINLNKNEWIKASTILRLEHELTHLSTMRILGEMRLNLLDELVADTMGQLIALGKFSSQIFINCLEIRKSIYTTELSRCDAEYVLLLLSERADELESVLRSQTILSTEFCRQLLLPWLCQQQLSKPITKVPGWLPM